MSLAAYLEGKYMCIDCSEEGPDAKSKFAVCRCTWQSVRLVHHGYNVAQHLLINRDFVPKYRRTVC
jgi:hypothetical protein